MAAERLCHAFEEGAFSAATGGLAPLPIAVFVSESKRP
ncbi:hypothetical protein Ga0074812_104426 [Parafrankia irregularis]|uniref:Uncharacterized protein n=1 Tax=Parafrankia irregularis TaxID=795642 RepID=A0A0S4QIH1_9ACTN|nr:hypothetical protein Ga0074812_104426 [Parafrankia irregularis]